MGLLNVARRGVGRALMDFGHREGNALESGAWRAGEDMFRRGLDGKKEALIRQIRMNPPQTPAGQMWNRELESMIAGAPDEQSLNAILQRLQAGQQRYGGQSFGGMI